MKALAKKTIDGFTIFVLSVVFKDFEGVSCLFRVTSPIGDSTEFITFFDMDDEVVYFCRLGKSKDTRRFARNITGFFGVEILDSTPQKKIFHLTINNEGLIGWNEEKYQEENFTECFWQ